MLEFRNLEKMFWISFVMLPVLTGLLAYDWLPNQAFDDRRHQILSSHEVCQDVGETEKCGEMIDAWNDTASGQTYTRQQFAAHRRAERWRMLYADFGYGLIGCLFFGYARSRGNGSAFFASFGKAVMVNVVAAAVMFLMAEA